MTDTLEIFGTEYSGVTGIKATDDNNTTKTYIRPQGAISISTNGNNIDVAQYATANVSVSGGSPTLQTKSKTYTPTTSQQTETVTADNGYDGLEEVDVTVNAMPDAYWGESSESVDIEDDMWTYERTYPNAVGGYVDSGDMFFAVGIDYETKTATPTESSQTITPTNDYTYLGAVTVNAIPSNYVGSGVTQRTSSDLSASGATVTAPAGYYASSASKSVTTMTLPQYLSSTAVGTFINGITGVEGQMRYLNIPAGYNATAQHYQVNGGTAGTPTATKGAVSNHSISVTPSVTNSAGYITSGTKTGTAVTVSASELVSGSETKTTNGTYNVTNLAEVVVDVQGGGTSGVQVAIATPASGANDYVMFSGLLGAPTSFSLINEHDIAIGTDPIVSALTYDGTDYVGQTITNTSNANASYVSTGFSHSYNNQYGTIMISNENVKFDTSTNYSLIYTYGGSSSDIHTSDVQVGSGATSITFSGLSGRPMYFSCVFKSNFGTSSGYQRVIAVIEYDSAIGGQCLDSSAHASNQYWTASYSGGNLTISSQGTNAGGYFHQPGYYQLTYAVDSSAPQYESVSKTYRASTSAQSETITPSSGYDAIEEVSVSIPAVTQTNLTADNIKSGTTISISNGQSNLWSVTGTYGGGGTSKNVQVLQSTSRTNSSSLTKVLGDLTVSKTGTYDIYWSGGRTNTSTSYTWGTRLYIDGTGYGTENTTWSNNCQSNHLSNVSLTANQKLSVYARGRTGSYYTFAPMLTIVEV